MRPGLKTSAFVLLPTLLLVLSADMAGARQAVNRYCDAGLRGCYGRCDLGRKLGTLNSTGYQNCMRTCASRHCSRFPPIRSQ